MHDIGSNLAPRETEAPKPSGAAFALFGLYVAFYAGFVVLNALSPTTMEWTPIAGVNLAILYGLGLIALAFAVAAIYEWLQIKPKRQSGSAR